MTGMVLAAVAMFGLSRLGATSSPNDTIAWFVLLGLGLSPVMVGATNVIVGNAPVALAGVASGLQSTAMQLGGALGTAVLGALMSAQDQRPRCRPLARRAPARAQHGTACPGERRGLVGAAPITHSTPARTAGVITQISHDTFVAGMHNAFLLAAVVALAGALIRADHQAGKRRRRSPRGHLTRTRDRRAAMLTMKAVQTSRSGVIEVVEVERPVPGPQDVADAGACLRHSAAPTPHSCTWAAFRPVRTGRPGRSPLGHEPAGEIIEARAAVTGLEAR